MTKLYPPIIENVIPACYKENGMVKLTIPFSINRAVSVTQIGGFELKIKTIQSGSLLYTIQTFEPANYKIDNKESYVIFYLNDTDNKLKVGQFYKIQLAYIENNENATIGYYSSIGTIKYTTKPKVYINNFENRKINNHTYNYVGYYDQTNGDITEKVYSYQFNFYNNKGDIIVTSNECLHNSANDKNVEISMNNFSVKMDLQENEIYFIQYTIVTINKLIISSPKYKITQRATIEPEIQAILDVQLNFNNGYIDINLYPLHNQKCSGSFVLSRADEDSTYNNWEELTKFKFFKEIPKKFLYRDFTVKQGKKYKYSIQQYNDDNLFSSRLYSKEIMADFEDAFLFDGKRQLKIRYNPKVSKFTNTVLETKQDTIGGHYPFIFRNGQVNYHEFSIAGLISYLSDEEFLFLSYDNLNLSNQPHRHNTKKTQEKIPLLDSVENIIAREREFKMEVLKWLNDGKPKIFRSPTEGNFIIRLMKVALSPEDKLGRMLHSFNSTAYEIAEYNNKNLQKFGIINIIDENKIIWQSNSVELKNCKPGIPLNVINDKTVLIYNLKFEGLTPGDIIEITHESNVKERITVGITGNYFISNNVPIKSVIIFPIYASTQGLLTYNYQVDNQNTFSIIKNIDYDYPTFKQFIGHHDNIILSDINNIKTQLTNWCYIKVRKRPIDRITKIEDKYYYGPTADSEEVNIDNLLPDILYQVVDWEKTDSNQFVPQYKFIERGYIDDFPTVISDYEPWIKINDEIIQVDDTLYLEAKYLENLAPITTFSIGNGVIVEISYKTKISEYIIEDTLVSKINYQIALNNLNNYLTNISTNEDKNQEEEHIQTLQTEYNNLIKELNIKLGIKEN